MNKDQKSARLHYNASLNRAKLKKSSPTSTPSLPSWKQAEIEWSVTDPAMNDYNNLSPTLPPTKSSRSKPNLYPKALGCGTTEVQ